MFARVLTAGLVIVLLLPALASARAPKKLETEEQQAFYALGVLTGRFLEPFDVDEKEIDIILAGMKDHLLEGEVRYDPVELQVAIEKLGNERKARKLARTREEGDALVAKSAKKRGATQLESGVVYQEIEAGTGEHPTIEDTVRVRFVGKLHTGTVFDQNLDKDLPLTVPLSTTIPCWKEGIPLMKAGGKARIVCPTDTGYGDKGRPPIIPPGTALDFEVELLEISETEEAESIGFQPRPGGQ